MSVAVNHCQQPICSIGEANHYQTHGTHVRVLHPVLSKNREEKIFPFIQGIKKQDINEGEFSS